MFWLVSYRFWNCAFMCLGFELIVLFTVLNNCLFEAFLDFLNNTSRLKRVFFNCLVWWLCVCLLNVVSRVDKFFVSRLLHVFVNSWLFNGFTMCRMFGLRCLLFGATSAECFIFKFIALIYCSVAMVCKVMF